MRGLIARGLIGACLAVMVSGLWSTATEAAEADVVLRNGKIYTADKVRSIRQAIAFKGNTIVAVGDDKDVAPLVGASTKVIDLGGKLVLPGLIDTHIHPIIGALNGAKCSLANIKATIDALKPVIQDCLADNSALPTSGSRRCSSTITASRRRQRISTQSGRKGRSRSGAMMGTVWVNSRGLALLGVTAETPDPPGGKIARDASGAPSGSFADSAAIFVLEKIPELGLEEKAEK